MQQPQFTLLAQSRARYYSKGAPAQFVRVELLRMEDGGSVVVTLTYKNVHAQLLTALAVHFRCKNRSGEVVFEDDFLYDNLGVGEGETFGANDAVYVSDEALGSVESRLVWVEYGEGRRFDLRNCQPVTLPKARQLSAQTLHTVNRNLHFNAAHFYPENVQDGWTCTCGEFNYGVGRGAAVCSNCGADKASLFASVRAAEDIGGGNIPLSSDMQYLPVTNTNARGGNGSAQYAENMDERERNVALGRAYGTAAVTAMSSSTPEPQSVRFSSPVNGGSAAKQMVFSPNTVDFILKALPLITASICGLCVAITAILA